MDSCNFWHRKQCCLLWVWYTIFNRLFFFCNK